MISFEQWALDYPVAAAALAEVLTASAYTPDGADGHAEEWAQQQARFAVARAGGLVWRNNVGATPSSVDCTCHRCGFAFEVKQRPVRYGLANDSAQLNKVFKSSDLIGVMPVKISPDMVGQTFGQFIALEVKRPHWHYTGKGREVAQAAFLALVAEKGGRASFTTGAL